MLSPISGSVPTGGSARDRKLLKVFRRLSSADKDAVQAFAEFLETRQSDVQVESPVSEPMWQPRPEGESVIAAIKRLTAIYPMIDKSTMLNETSSLMTQHVMQGREASEVIDELETLFADTYQSLLEQQHQ